MDLKHFGDNQLIASLEHLVKHERKMLTRILHHLREIEARRLFSSLGYKSLFDYAVKRLGYSEDQAARRIYAMRMMQEIPQVEQKLESGALTLTNVGLAHALFKKEGCSKEKKTEILAEIENKSAREAETIIRRAKSEPGPLFPDRIRPIADGNVEISFVAKEDLVGKISNLKGLLAHKLGPASIGQVVDIACDEAINKLSPLNQPQRTSPGAPRVTRVTESKRQEVWKRAQGKCEHCGSQYKLEVDHVQPKALGGSDELENLRLLCRSCNERAAIKAFGVEKMRKYQAKQ